MTAPSVPALRKAGILLLALYVVAGVVYSCLLPAAGRFSDEKEYLLLTDHLRHGPGFSMDGAHLTAIRSPGYPFFMAAVAAVGGGIVALRIVQFLLIGGIALLLARLFPEEDRPAALLVTTLVISLYPLFFYTGSTLYPQTLSGFLFVLALVMLLRPNRGWPIDLAIGATFGFLILVVPTFLFTLFVVLVVALALKIIRWPAGLVILAVAGVLVGSWTARNFAEFHEFVPVASNSGANFLIGNCENTIPTGGSGNVDRTRYFAEVERLQLNEFQADRFYRQAAIDWIEKNPGRAFVLYLEKTANFFNVYNEYAPESQGEVTLWRQVVLGACYGLMLALLAWRLTEMKRFPLTTTEKLFLAVYVLSAFTSALFFTRIRLRLPYDYLLVAVIALHLCRRFGPGAWAVKARSS